MRPLSRLSRKAAACLAAVSVCAASPLVWATPAAAATPSAVVTEITADDGYIGIDNVTVSATDIACEGVPYLDEVLLHFGTVEAATERIGNVYLWYDVVPRQLPAGVHTVWFELLDGPCAGEPLMIGEFEALSPFAWDSVNISKTEVFVGRPLGVTVSGFSCLGTPYTGQALIAVAGVGSMTGSNSGSVAAPVQPALVGSDMPVFVIPSTGACAGLEATVGTVDVLSPATSVALELPEVTAADLVLLTAQVSSQYPSHVPVGDVVFSIDGEEVGTAAVDGDGVAELSLPPLPAGDHEVTAQFVPTGAGNPWYGSSASETLTVAKVAPAMELSATSPVTYGTAGQVKVALSGPAGQPVPSGTVRVSVDGVEVASGVLDDAIVAFDLGVLDAGGHAIEAVYVGDGLYTSASASTQLVVDRASASLSLSASKTTVTVGEPVTFVVSAPQPVGSLAALSAAPRGADGGTVTLFANGTEIGTFELAAAGGSLTHSFDEPGTYSVTAAFSGSSNLLPASPAAIADVTIVVLATQQPGEPPASGGSLPHTGGSLPHTGGEVAPLVVAAAGLLAAGVTLMAFSRRST